MIVERNYTNSANTIFECDRCKRHYKGTNDVFRVTITNIRSSKSLKSMHLCRHCAKVFLAFVKKGVNKKTNGGSDC